MSKQTHFALVLFAAALFVGLVFAAGFRASPADTEYQRGLVRGREEVLEQMKNECELLQDPSTLDMYYECSGEFTDY